ncbi:hypothetical protein Leryth_023971 [Lithospermum erythrorhizon]|nr:hypothetical protein Leryth_023971 [Lithospermum erythrorhizon]
MDGGAIASASASMRVNSSSMWRNSGNDVFSRSGRDNDDEEHLKWAALEKLPTFDRLRKGLLFGSQGAFQEVDVDDLGYQERKLLLERLIKSEDDKSMLSLLKLRRQASDRVCIVLPTIEVRYDHLSIEAQAYVGSRALPSFTNFTMNIVEGLCNSLHILSSRKRTINILRDVSGIIKPCRLTLLLGPPASGKTTLLLALAGRLEKELKMKSELRESLKNLIAEMLADLARREKAANLKPDPDMDIFMKAAATRYQEASVVTDYILKILGLEVCADTMVGDQMLRGISGGQKKRVTTGELLVGPATALFMDEISTGLDSSTTFSIVNSLRQYVHILKGTAFVSLLQPAPETYNLFDDIVLISDGQIVYQGPREHVLEFFESMGFVCPERKGVADFLQEVTSKKDQNQYWARRDEPYHFITESEFAEAFQSFHVGRRLGDELATPFDKSKSHPAALTTERYGVNKKELLKACTSRELLLMKRNSFVYYFKLFQLIILALLEMSLFLRTKMHHNSANDGQVYVGAIFFTIMVMMFNGMSEMALTIFKLPVFFKQRDLLFYPSWAYALPTWILKIPISLVEAVVWVVLTYYEIGLDPNITRFLKHYLLLLLVHQTASGLFRFVGAMGRDMIVANTFGSFTMLILVSLSGIILSRNDVKKWWIWGYWASPLMYAQNALLVNEFVGQRWNKPGPIPNETLGTTVVKSRGSFPDAYCFLIKFISHREGSLPLRASFQSMLQEMKYQGVEEDKLVLLNSVSGSFRPGVLTALMGVSGAGKTTLMDVTEENQGTLKETSKSLDIQRSKKLLLVFQDTVSRMIFTLPMLPCMSPLSILLGFNCLQKSIMQPESDSKTNTLQLIAGSMFFGIWNIFRRIFYPRSSRGYLSGGGGIYYYACSFAWTLYGLLVSQFGDVQDKIRIQMKQFNKCWRTILDSHDFVWSMCTWFLSL